MSLLILGLVLFLGSTGLDRRRAGATQRRRLGEGPWKALVLLISLAGFCVVIVGYAARQNPVVLYSVPPV